MQHANAEYLVVDWGTTNFRAFALDANGQVVEQTSSNLGLMQVEDGQFAQVLESVLSQWLDNFKHLPIYMAGMVGSAQGWVNVDYVATPVDSEALAAKTHKFELPWGANGYIIPGVNHQNSAGIFDVMRGEEVQLFGLAQLLNSANFDAVFPGTHSKHIKFADGKIQSFASFMTGEVFGLLLNNSILGRGLPKQQDDESAFMKGVIESQTSCLTNRIFAARTHRLFQQVADEHIADYLSGLLIGHEIRQLSAHNVLLVGGGTLCKRYQTACETLNKSATVYSGDECFLSGMQQLIQELANAK
ncbi:hypothetical protein DS2_09157 [Catenovulum agarivorans DS-2]|uniref:2-dehydro-3-deoxygalactonokinase n=1 Tax=Catenovulum agarivorans DS-2 TaxID=1328313 RepID=W7QY71_9ALTE|nr:2-dehydro-3-deoxygalactonokinase [Catenovulum agarivorans]EWH10255.1 hypothetical protein DS2_09157 [Catenovulum agarivorans DS-2]